jgi:hypothetical protein
MEFSLPYVERKGSKWCFPGRELKSGEVVAIPWDKEGTYIYICNLRGSLFRMLNLRTHGICTNPSKITKDRLGLMSGFSLRRVPVSFPTVAMFDLSFPEKYPIHFVGKKYCAYTTITSYYIGKNGLVQQENKIVTDLAETSGLPEYISGRALPCLTTDLREKKPEWFDSLEWYDASGDAPPPAVESDSFEVPVIYSCPYPEGKEAQAHAELQQRLGDKITLDPKLRHCVFTSELRYQKELEAVLADVMWKYKGAEVGQKMWAEWRVPDEVEKRIRLKPPAEKTAERKAPRVIVEPNWQNDADNEIVKPFGLSRFTGESEDVFRLSAAPGDIPLEEILKIDASPDEITGEVIADTILGCVDEGLLSLDAGITNASETDDMILDFENCQDAVSIAHGFLKLLKSARSRAKVRAVMTQAAPWLAGDE